MVTNGEQTPLQAIPGNLGDIPIFFCTPNSDGPWPGIIVIHDALGMTEDLHHHTRWLADSGYLAVAPNLFHWGNRASCLIKTMRDLSKGDKGQAFDDIASVRSWLINQPGCSGKIGIMGFCYGGGFALALAPNHGYSASAVNYGAIADWGWKKLAESCPVVASYGQKDPTLKGQAKKLDEILTEHEVPHDIKEYEGVGHGFMNLHSARDSNWIFKALSWASRTKYDENATVDARRRILAFFNRHLKN